MNIHIVFKFCSIYRLWLLIYYGTLEYRAESQRHTYFNVVVYSPVKFHLVHNIDRGVMEALITGQRGCQFSYSTTDKHVFNVGGAPSVGGASETDETFVNR